MFVPNVKGFSEGVPEVLHSQGKQMGFGHRDLDQRHLISSSLPRSESL